MDVGLLEAVFDAPIGTLLAVAGIVLLLVAAGLRWKFEPGTYGRLFAGAMGIVLVAVGTVLVVTDESPDKVAALPTATASPSVTATATDTATGRANRDRQRHRDRHNHSDGNPLPKGATGSRYSPRPAGR